METTPNSAPRTGVTDATTIGRLPSAQQSRRTLFAETPGLTSAATTSEIIRFCNNSAQRADELTARLAQMDSVQARLLDVTRSLAGRVDTIEESNNQAAMADEIKDIFDILGTFPSLRAECQAAAARAEAASAAAAAAPRSHTPPPPAVTNATHAYDIHHSADFVPEVTVEQFMKQQIPFPHTVHTALPSTEDPHHPTPSSRHHIDPANFYTLLRRGYMDVSGKTEKDTPKALALNFLEPGGDIIFSNFLRALDSAFTATRSGHAPALLNLDHRLARDPYDGVCNNTLATTLNRVADGRTRQHLQHIRDSDPAAQADGRYLILHLRAAIAQVPRSEHFEFLEAAKAVRLTELQDPAQALTDFQRHVKAHRRQAPAFSDLDEQNLTFELLRLSEAEDTHRIHDTPLYHSLVADYRQQNHYTRQGYRDPATGVGGALAFYTAIQNRWYTTGRHHSAVLYPSSSPRAHALTTATQGQKKKAPAAPATGTPAATVATPANAPASSVRWADRPGSPPARVPSPGPPVQSHGSANPNRQDSTSSSTRRLTYNSPRRDASQQEIEKYEQQLLDQAAARHPGKANTDTTPKGSWDGYRFTPDPAQGKLMPCRACFSTHTITVHHSLGRAGCPCTIQERAQTWQKARQHQSAQQPAMHSATTSLPITTAPPASSAPRGAPPQQPVHQSLPPPVSAIPAQTPSAPSGTAAVAGHDLAQLSALVAQQIAQQQAAQQPPPSRYYQNPQAGPQYFCWTSQPQTPGPVGHHPVQHSSVAITPPMQPTSVTATHSVQPPAQPQPAPPAAAASVQASTSYHPHGFSHSRPPHRPGFRRHSPWHTTPFRGPPGCHQ
ncbi:hypothetical protein CYMTET_11700 [Cymbomonas tetramitiformis]|uniref:Uncharacterized protein n=1 Tax=Cymbomonas tetramitiformis TaxID=36881 RepID=A0AAE0GLT8_9CHLO|nr:hypothetical protein CYMTET_11700 [Cymbomonas tetramitiformis]